MSIGGSYMDLDLFTTKYAIYLFSKGKKKPKYVHGPCCQLQHNIQL